MQGTKNLTKGSIGNLLFKLSMPIIGTSFIQMAYTLMDMAWVGRIGSESVATIGAVGILMWTAIAIALFNKVGAEVSVGQSLGAQSIEDAKSYASHNISMSLIISLLLGFLFFVAAYPILNLFGLNSSITDDSVSYLRIMVTAFPFIFMSNAFTGIYNASGVSKVPFYINGLGLVVNMVLDPLFILVLHWGTDGAALATWISQAAVFFFFVYELKVRKNLLDGFKFFTPLRKDRILKLLHIGAPVALLNVLFSFINFFMGRTASFYGGHIGLLTLTTGAQIESISWNTSQGFSTGLSTFIAQNYAAGEKDRMKRAYHITLLMTALFGIFCMILFIGFGENLFALIIPDVEAYKMGGIYMQINGYAVIFMMMEITSQGLFYGISRTMPPAIISISFNLMRIPLALFLAGNGMGVNGVWWAISISSMCKGLVSFLWFKSLQKKVF